MDEVTLNIVPDPPMGDPYKKVLERIISETKLENRENKISSILNNTEYKEKKIQDHPEYKDNYSLYYIDFNYSNHTWISHNH